MLESFVREQLAIVRSILLFASKNAFFTLLKKRKNKLEKEKPNRTIVTIEFHDWQFHGDLATEPARINFALST